MKKIIATLLFLSAIPFANAEDPYIEELYDLYCSTCHGVKGSGAPMAFTNDWRPYLRKGMNTLVNNSIQGIGNMPAMGTCSECGPEDLEDLIKYMSQQEK